MYKCDVCKKRITRKRVRVAVTPDDMVLMMVCSRKCARVVKNSYLQEEAYA